MINDNYRFPIEREPLLRGDGVDTRYDALYRADTGSQISVVSRDYQLITHEQAMDSVYGLLDAMGETHEDFRIATTNQGKRLFAEVKLPDRKFDVSGDGIMPSVIVENSLDKTKSFVARFGAYRLVCSNGAIVGTKVVNIALSHYKENINMDKVLYAIEQGINHGQEFFVTKAREMIDAPAGEDLLQHFIEDEAFPVLFRYSVAQYMAEQRLADFGYKRTSNISKPVEVEGVRSDLTKYVFWNVLTAVATHHVQSQRTRIAVDQAIARRFFG